MIHPDFIMISVASSLKVLQTHPFDCWDKSNLHTKIGILQLSDIMAYLRLSGDDVVSNIFVDEESFDDSDSESGDDVNGYLGAFAMSCDELVEESCILTVDEFEADELSSEEALSNNEELLDTCSESDSE